MPTPALKRAHLVLVTFRGAERVRQCVRKPSALEPPILEVTSRTAFGSLEPRPRHCTGTNSAPGTRVSSAPSSGLGHELIDQVAVNRVVDALVDAVAAMTQTLDSDEDC